METSSHSPEHITVAGADPGDYVVLEHREDGSMVIAPDTSAAAILRRLSARPATLEEFEAEHGPLQPPDDEG